MDETAVNLVDAENLNEKLEDSPAKVRCDALKKVPGYFVGMISLMIICESIIIFIENQSVEPTKILYVEDYVGKGSTWGLVTELIELAKDFGKLNFLDKFITCIQEIYTGKACKTPTEEFFEWSNKTFSPTLNWFSENISILYKKLDELAKNHKILKENNDDLLQENKKLEKKLDDLLQENKKIEKKLDEISQILQNKADKILSNPEIKSNISEEFSLLLHTNKNQLSDIICKNNVFSSATKSSQDDFLPKDTPSQTIEAATASY